MVYAMVSSHTVTSKLVPGTENCLSLNQTIRSARDKSRPMYR